MEAVTGDASIWHAVTVYRTGKNIFVFDPAFQLSEGMEKIREGEVVGIRQIFHLRRAMEKNKEKNLEWHITGVGDQGQNCLALACAWLEGVGTGEVDVGVNHWVTLTR